MTQISLFMKQNHRHREQTGACQGGRRWGKGGVGSWHCRYVIIYRIENQQGSTIEHRELCTISYDKPQWKKNIFKKEYICLGFPGGVTGKEPTC